MGTIPVWIKDLIDRNNAENELADRGIPGLLGHFSLVMRACALFGRPEFLKELAASVEKYEAALPAQDKIPRLNLRVWMQDALSEFLGFPVEVPEPPALNRKQSRALKKFGLRVVFIPAVPEERFPGHTVKPDWGEYLSVDEIERIPLQGRWVAVETIAKPDYTAGEYPDDKLAKAIGIESRFGHPYSGKGEGDDLVEDLVPKIADLLGFASDKVMSLSAEEWNFYANLRNWLREHRKENLPDLGATVSVEWVRNACGSGNRLLVGNRDDGGLAYVNGGWHGCRGDGIGFRVLVVL